MHLSFKRSNLTLQGFTNADLEGDLDGKEHNMLHFYIGWYNYQLEF